MRNLTPIELLLVRIDEWIGGVSDGVPLNNSQKKALRSVMEMGKDVMKDERKIIQDAFNAGASYMGSCEFEGYREYKDAKAYFDKTFANESNSKADQPGSL